MNRYKHSCCRTCPLPGIIKTFRSLWASVTPNGRSSNAVVMCDTSGTREAEEQEGNQGLIEGGRGRRGQRSSGSPVEDPSVHDGTRCFLDVSNTSQLRSYLKVGGNNKGPSWNPWKTRPLCRSRVS
jgi:hypothetical protein